MIREAELHKKVSLTGSRSYHTAPPAVPSSSSPSATGDLESVPGSCVIEIKAQDLDPSTPEIKPKGWGAIKQRKVYIKEYQDRRDGADEDDIFNKRYHREREAEDEMSQSLSVHGRIQIIETRMRKMGQVAAPVFPKGYTHNKIK